MIKQTDYIKVNNAVKIYFKDSNMSVEGIVVDIDANNCVIKSVNDNSIIFIPNILNNIFAIKVIGDLDTATVPTKPKITKIPDNKEVPSPEQLVDYKLKEIAEVKQTISEELTTQKFKYTTPTPNNIVLANKHYSQGNYGLPKFLQKPVSK